MSFFISTNLQDVLTCRVNPNINYGLWVIMRINVGSSVIIYVQFWWGMLIIGEAMHLWGQRIQVKFLYFVLNFAVNL